MSEYQYYEFLAIDRPLTAEEMAALRALSTRAHITPVSFTNEYQWGNFRGNPDELMRRYFDAHVYVANWMTAVFMLRLPLEAISKKTAQAMAMAGVLDFAATRTHWVITWSLDESENYDSAEIEDGRGWMARLAPIRDELLRGDIRSLYIGWLAAVSREMADADDLEPLPMEGLGSLTAAQQALTQFLEVDEDLLAGAGSDSPAQQAAEPSPQERDEWLAGLPHEEVFALLQQLLAGQGLRAERALKSRFSAWWRGLRGASEGAPRRSVAELLEKSETARISRFERQKIEQERLNARRRQEREAYLATLAKDFPKAWKAAGRKIERGSGLAYDEACGTLIDIAAAYALHASRNAFNQELQRFMAVHLRRKALVQRLVKAGIWREK